MAGVQDRAVTHAEVATASAHPDIAESGQKGVKTVAACTTLRNQVKKV